MPIYEYRCRNGHQFEVSQPISADPVSVCRECGEPVERVFHPVAVHFKGSGFYTTDYARKASAKGSQSSDGGGESSESAPDKKPADKKPAKASSSSNDE
jgi:putative FmdB family regulatory protein